MLFSPLSLLYFLPILLLSLLRTFTRLRGIGRIYGRDLHPTFMTQRKIVQKFSPAGEHGVQERPERPPFPRLSSLFPAASFFSRTPSNAFTSSEMIYELFTSDLCFIPPTWTLREVARKRVCTRSHRLPSGKLVSNCIVCTLEHTVVSG